MVEAARQWMDLVVPENLLEHHPLDPVDVVVLANVVEPYPPEVRRLLFEHCAEFISPGGRAIVVLAAGGGLGTSADTGLDLVFPSPSVSLGIGNAPLPDEVEDDLAMAGFDIDSTELVETKTAKALDLTSPMLGEEPTVQRRVYALLVARKPKD